MCIGIGSVMHFVRARARESLDVALEIVSPERREGESLLRESDVFSLEGRGLVRGMRFLAAVGEGGELSPGLICCGAFWGLFK